MSNKNQGKIFEKSIEQSCEEQGIFYFRVRDVNPMALKKNFRIPQNKYDCLIYYKAHLFPMEFKSTKSKSISFSESVIKSNQIKNLYESLKYKGVIPGFLFNFREPINKTYFIHIKDFIKYKDVAENVLKHTYKNKVNKSSIPIGICEEIGTEVKNVKKKTNYRYYINLLLDELIKKYGVYK